MVRRYLFIPAILAAALAAVAFERGAFAQTSSPIALPSDTTIPDLLPVAQETQMALDAAPEDLRSGAGVYVLEQHGFVKVRSSSNGFTCIVNRDAPLNRKPVCYDAEGTATILPVVLRYGELLMQRVPLAAIRNEIAQGFADGKYVSPRRPGVAYMLSGEVRVYNAQTKSASTFPPHVMFYAPNLTNRDIGSDGNFDQGLPSIGYQGPQGFMIVVCGQDCGKPAT
jgi:hypothetical protein